MSAPRRGHGVPSRRPHWHSPVAALAFVFAAGCAAPGHRTPPPDARYHPPTWGQALREHLLQFEWRGKSYAHLVESMGPPLRMLAIPGGDPGLAWAVFYGIRDTRADCFDAFTIMIVDGEERVVDYFCR